MLTFQVDAGEVQGDMLSFVIHRLPFSQRYVWYPGYQADEWLTLEDHFHIHNCLTMLNTEQLSGEQFIESLISGGSTNLALYIYQHSLIQPSQQAMLMAENGENGNADSGA